jgi:hypothetical protein
MLNACVWGRPLRGLAWLKMRALKGRPRALSGPQRAGSDRIPLQLGGGIPCAGASWATSPWLLGCWEKQLRCGSQGESITVILVHDAPGASWVSCWYAAMRLDASSRTLLWCGDAGMVTRTAAAHGGMGWTNIAQASALPLSLP